MEFEDIKEMAASAVESSGKMKTMEEMGATNEVDVKGSNLYCNVFDWLCQMHNLDTPNMIIQMIP